MTDIVGEHQEIIVTGGWSHSDALMAAKRRRLGTLRLSAVQEAGARGAAIYAGRAAGVLQVGWVLSGASGGCRIVTLTPNPSVDRTLVLDTFTRGAVNRCTATFAEPSGKGINVALALHSHGVPALAVLPSGGPAGEQLVQLLSRRACLAGP